MLRQFALRKGNSFLDPFSRIGNPMGEKPDWEYEANVSAVWDRYVTVPESLDSIRLVIRSPKSPSDHSTSSSPAQSTTTDSGSNQTAASAPVSPSSSSSSPSSSLSPTSSVPPLSNSKADSASGQISTGSREWIGGAEQSGNNNNNNSISNGDDFFGPAAPSTNKGPSSSSTSSTSSSSSSPTSTDPKASKGQHAKVQETDKPGTTVKNETGKNGTGKYGRAGKKDNERGDDNDKEQSVPPPAPVAENRFTLWWLNPPSPAYHSTELTLPQQEIPRFAAALLRLIPLSMSSSFRSDQDGGGQEEVGQWLPSHTAALQIRYNRLQKGAAGEVRGLRGKIDPSAAPSAFELRWNSHLQSLVNAFDCLGRKLPEVVGPASVTMSLDEGAAAVGKEEGGGMLTTFLKFLAAGAFVGAVVVAAVASAGGRSAQVEAGVRLWSTAGTALHQLASRGAGSKRDSRPASTSTSLADRAGASSDPSTSGSQPEAAPRGMPRGGPNQGISEAAMIELCDSVHRKLAGRCWLPRLTGPLDGPLESKEQQQEEPLSALLYPAPQAKIP
eukprot:gene6031-3426_t